MKESLHRCWCWWCHTDDECHAIYPSRFSVSVPLRCLLVAWLFQEFASRMMEGLHVNSTALVTGWCGAGLADIRQLVTLPLHAKTQRVQYSYQH